MGKRIAIVGAGLGGLALALRLGHRGHKVTIFEKTNHVGGRNAYENVGGCNFDGGPTLLMMLDPFRKLFADVGEDFDSALNIQLCDPSYRVFYGDGTRLDATTDIGRMKAELAKLNVSDSEKYPKFLADLKELYDESIPQFVRKNYNSPADFLAPNQLKTVLKHGLLGNLAKRVARTFEDPRVRMLFSFQSMYLGLSPYDAPFVYATLAYMEFGEGIYYPEGGLPAISEKTAELARSRGAAIQLESAVKATTNRTVTLESGETLEFDSVVLNADLPYAKQALKGQSIPNWRTSCSAYMMYMEYEGGLPNLLHHNVLFGADFKGNLDNLFKHQTLTDDPAFYVCLSNRSEASRAPKGMENVFVLVPCPNLDMTFTPDAATKIEAAVFKRLERECGFDPSKVVEKKTKSPLEWKSELNLHKGAAFGLSHDLFQSAFMRPSNKDSDGQIYVGASTVPGNGLPMVLISAELADLRLHEVGI